MITGTMVNYYFHCKRQCWLFANRFNLEDNSEDVRIGKILHEISNVNEVSFEGIKIDKISEQYVTEVKKSDADIQAAKMQLLYYLFVLKNKGIDKKGKLECIEKNKQNNKVHYIELDEKHTKLLTDTLITIKELINNEIPPVVEMSAKCKKCAYFDYCYI